MNNSEMAKYAGEEYYRKPSLNFPTIKFNGKDGKFYSVRKENDEWVNEEIGSQISCVILRIRRQLSKFGKDGREMGTNEHNHSSSNVTLFDYFQKKNIASGKASDIRQQFPELRTEQILYILIDNIESQASKIVKIRVKGASLGSESKPKDSIPFYQYISNYGKDEHLWQFKTSLIGKEEKGKLGSYYAISFEKGIQLSEEELADIVTDMKSLSEAIEQVDSYQGGKSETKEMTFDSTDSQVEDEEKKEEINVDNIPF